MEKEIKIALGSTSQHKIEAVKQACQQLGLLASVVGVKAASDQNEQPVGLNETYQGAFSRAQGAKAQSPEAVAIGIESGIFITENSENPLTIDLAIIVVLTLDNRRIVATTPGVVFPEDCLAIAKERGFATTTAGSVVAEKLGGDPTDPHSTLTNGAVSRNQTLVAGLVIALAQL
ncbi:hypothetical protein COZ78_01900 [bacterium (Candidatus Gribaldobacteria) CG_4_8_14_3_um_filter_42_11]|uniref:inosine/xanthosine triphosphatase n=2 Tax=Candidatus Gribaldobacteria TaxID=2798536 RepID=A0A2M7IYC1_9BACT|nr:MAG: hypothetical protein COS21_02055 [bacterium (Candidatus Gribaldobacteria) CG02_land_8_20_14_3_00_41_15]PIX03152.1 MAG: hypothetical protein COZ78_01900 [bacterium (Candidatus Gribaldobacteria) CG_4_8_14_3_um_filter_42_11]